MNLENPLESGEPSCHQRLRSQPLDRAMGKHPSVKRLEYNLPCVFDCCVHERMYSRSGNPSRDALETCLASVERGEEPSIVSTVFLFSNAQGSRNFLFSIIILCPPSLFALLRSSDYSTHLHSLPPPAAKKKGVLPVYLCPSLLCVVHLRCDLS